MDPLAMDVAASIPGVAAIERDLPIELMHQWAKREGHRKRPIYELHKWWARRLGTTFRMILLAASTPAKKGTSVGAERFYRAHDMSGLTVLDPFMGGGTSLVEAAKCGANVIGIDIDPVACFITRKELEGIQPSLIREGFEEVASEVKDRILLRYKTTLPDGTPAQTVYAFWVDEVTCPDCGTVGSAHPHYQLSRDPKNRKQSVFCGSCGHVTLVPIHWDKLACPACSERTTISDGPVKKGRFVCRGCESVHSFAALSSPEQLPTQRLFALDVVTEEGVRTFKSIDREDVRSFLRAEREWQSGSSSARFVPDDKIPADARYDNRPLIYGYRRYSDLFNPRQLLSLSEIAAAISTVRDRQVRGFLALAFSDCLASNNMFCSFAFDYRKLTPLFGLHAYRRIVRPVEGNVWGASEGRGSFARCAEKVIRGKEYALKPFEFKYKKGRPVPIQTGDRIDVAFDRKKDEPARSAGAIRCGSSSSLTGVADGSVDLILSDPPYYDNLPYSELSDFYHVWLRKLLGDEYLGAEREHTPWLESLFVGRKGADRDHEHKEYVATLRTAFHECARALRADGLMVFTFHHGDAVGWAALGESILDSPFRITKVLPVRSEGGGAFHSYGGTIKWDSVIVCRKADRTTARPRHDLVEAAVQADISYWKARLGRRLRAPDIQSLRRSLYIQQLSRYAWTPETASLLETLMGVAKRER